MKLLGATVDYGDEVSAMVGYGERFFFDGNAPDPDRLLFFELEGLKNQSHDSIRAWIAAKNSSIIGRRNIARFNEEHWRYATPWDILTAENYTSYVYSLTNYFTIEELNPFFQEQLPKLAETFESVVDEKEDKARVKKIDSVEDYTRRVAYPIYYMPYALTRLRTEIAEKLDRKLMESFRQNEFDLGRAIKFADKLDTTTVRLNLAMYIANELIAQEIEPAKFLASIRKVGKRKILRDVTQWAPGFWDRVSPHLDLPPNVAGQKIDITDATEVTVPANWDLVNGKRAGTVVIGRTALYVQTGGGKGIYLRGERKLKFKVRQAGGSLEYANNTLTVDDDGLGRMLLDVERIDTLASLDAKAALRMAEDKNLPSDHPIFAAAERATDDYKQARVLADLLIEELIGIDADIARSMARSQARANRR